ncbi:MAG: hypothetical protein K0S41_1468 [Anaerocolumna sp.]|jgi:hypothetical protein|nr:hypothetical protein [Anaerocolumna sp.]
MLNQLQEVIDYLNENMSDPVPRYILKKEIMGDSSFESEYGRLKESKWYKQLFSEQWENGSWGRFHTQDSKSPIKQKFTTTENALKRVLELGLGKNNDEMFKCIQLMERYILGQEDWLDKDEKHAAFKIAFRTIIAANLALFDPNHTVIQTKKEKCVDILSKSFINGSLDEGIWEKEYRACNEVFLNPFTSYITWLLQNNDYLDKSKEREYLEYIWNRKDGIYYCTGNPPSDIQSLESNNFINWISGLECLSGFLLFPEFMSRGTTDHLLNEIQRLMYQDIDLPNAHPIFGHYSESWSKKQTRKNDLILRILRILMKC